MGELLVHRHLIVRAEVEKPFQDCGLAEQWIKELVDKINMKILMGPFVTYSDMIGNRGLTAVTVIETSHIALHLWDEVSPALAQLDIYTCSCLDLPIAFDHFKILQPTKLEYKFIDRDHDLTEIEASSGFIEPPVKHVRINH